MGKKPNRYGIVRAPIFVSARDDFAKSYLTSDWAIDFLIKIDLHYRNPFHELAI
jgi:hypothetical protein